MMAEMEAILPVPVLIVEDEPKLTKITNHAKKFF